MKKLLAVLLFIVISVSSLYGKSLYIQVIALSSEENLFNISYRLNELGYNMNVSEKGSLYKVYTGPFEDKYSANRALREIKKKIAGDAFIVNAKIEGDKLLVSKEIKQAQKPLKAQLIVIENAKVSEIKSVDVQEYDASKQMSSSGSSKSSAKENNFFVGVSVGVSKFDLERKNISLSSVGYTYGFALGYYFTQNIFMTLNYDSSALEGLHLNTFTTSINYKLDPIFLVSPYAGLIGGLSTLTWENNAYVENDESAFVGGVHLGLEIPISDNATVVLFTKYMLLDYKSVAVSSAQKTIKFNNEVSGNVGFRYNF